MFSELLRDWRKGAGHKYMRRTPYMDKRGRKRYRYTYQAQRGGGVTQAESMVAGAAFRLTHKGKKGHFHIESVDEGKLKLKHDESGGELELTKGEFQRLLQLEHGEALGQAAERAEATARQAKKTGSAKQIKRAEAEAKRMRKIAEQGKEQEAKEPEPAPEPALPRIEGSLLEESFKPTVSKEQARFYNRAKMFERSQADLQRDLDQTINRIDQEGLAAIKAGADEARVRDEVQASAQRASDLYMKMIARSGDFANPFATGRGGFNFKRNDKKRALYDKASGEFLGAVDEAKNKIRALVRSSRVIRSGQSDTVQKLRDRIAELESARTKIKEDNKAARKVKGETTPTYSLSNLGAEIRRLKERLKAEERKPKTGALKQEAAELEDLEVKIRDQTLSPQTRRRALDSVRDQRLEVATKLGELRAKEESGESGAGAPSTLYKLPSGGRVEIRQDQEDNRIRLFFPNKPSAEQRQRLKKRGFRWSPRAGAWQRQLTDNAVIASGSVLRSMGAELVREAPEPAPEQEPKSERRSLAVQVQELKSQIVEEAKKGDPEKVWEERGEEFVDLTLAQLQSDGPKKDKLLKETKNPNKMLDSLLEKYKDSPKNLRTALRNQRRNISRSLKAEILRGEKRTGGVGHAKSYLKTLKALEEAEARART